MARDTPDPRPREPSRTRAVVYARISMDREGSGLGVERQRDDCLRLAEERNWDVVDVIADNDISAFSGKVRPGYVALLERMRARSCDVVMAWHVDRLHRSPTELEEYIAISEASAITTVTVKAGELDLSTAAGRMVARMLGAAARHESEQKSERIRRKRRQDAESGLAHGPLGYGYDSQQRVVEVEAAVVREVAIRLLAGDTLYRIASDLNERNVPTPGAGRWYHHHVREVLRRAMFASVEPSHAWVEEVDPAVCELVRILAGEDALSESATRTLASDVSHGESSSRLGLERALRTPGALGNGQVAKILSKADVLPPRTTWRAANLRTMIRRGTLCGWRDFGPGGRGGGDMVAEGAWEPILTVEQSRRIRRLLDAPERKRTGRERRLLLSSILVCGRCGAPLGGHNSLSDGSRYACSSQPGLTRCGRLTVVAAPVDELVVAAVVSVLSDLDVRRRHASKTRVLAAEAEEELADTQAIRDEYARDAASGRLSRREWYTLRESLDRRENAARSALRRFTSEGPTLLDALPTSGEVKVREWWEAADLRKQREVIRLLVERIVIRPASKSSRTFDPSRVEPPVWRF